MTDRGLLNLRLLAGVAFLVTASAAIALAAEPSGGLDWNIIIVALISAFVTITTSAAAVIVGVLNNRKISDLHSQVNSRLDMLLKTSGQVEREAGRAEGKLAEQARAVQQILKDDAKQAAALVVETAGELTKKDGR